MTQFEHVNIAIVGCGWLGQQIGVAFLEKGHSVYGSFRSEQTKRKIESLGLKAFDLEGPISFNTDILFLCLPPSSATHKFSYDQLLINIVKKFDNDVKVIFTSSTGVYPKKEGEFSEDYMFLDAEKKTILYQAENDLRQEIANRLTILRLGGLIGPRRHPIKFISSKKYDDDGSSPLALIDSRDICRLALFIVELDLFGELFNVVYPTKLTKKEYYFHLANRMELAAPAYGTEKGMYRKISSKKLGALSGFELKYNIQKYERELLFV